ncbi:Vacuolar protein sorting-associated protein 20 [Actinomortierella wolfii]|nr:Vacuolar protein sorting-associated protein 20 [Actinomortierella wolfii]
MGSSTSKAAKITSHDRAILDLKLDAVIAKELENAKSYLAKGEKKKALLALRRKKFQEGLLEKATMQMTNLDELTYSIEHAMMEKQVLDGLKAGNQVLKELHKEMSLADVEKLMDETHEAIAYQNEIDELLSTRLSVAEAEEIERELDELVAAELQMPDVPLPSAAERERQRREQEEQEEAEQELQSGLAKASAPTSKAKASKNRARNEPLLA